MTEILHPDLCVLGGGCAGLAAARTAAGLGAKVVLVEKRPLGGSSLGESFAAQAFFTAAQTAAKAHAARLGVSGDLRVDLVSLRAHLKDIVAHFALQNAPTRFAAMNVKIIRAPGSFVKREVLP
jgi:pyruvate/2-oxoglutarate dehydrogenase complex dihydrolipoamide dehydrogenase (E3) component